MSLLRKGNDFFTEVALGNVGGHSLLHKFGSGNVGTTLVPVATALVYRTPIAPVSLEFVSSSASDALNSTGAFEITFIGLDANWAEQTVVMAAHATNGTTAVAITGTWLRLYRWYVSQSGAYATQTVGSHVGTLTARVAGAGETWSQISILPFPMGQSEIGIYTIPLGKTAYLLSKDILVDGTKEANVVLFQRPLANDVTTPFTGALRVIEHEVGISKSYSKTYVSPRGPYVGPCDIGFMASIATGNSEISVEFELLLVDT